jgi:hypothetical protein
MLDRTTRFTLNVSQQGDALALLQVLSDSFTPLAFFDPPAPQHVGSAEIRE